jgi:hypothetical protein
MGDLPKLVTEFAQGRATLSAHLLPPFGRLGCWLSDRPEAHERDGGLRKNLSPTAK